MPAADLFACSAVDALVAHFGLPGLNALLRRPGSLEAALGLTPAELEALWQADTRRRCSAQSAGPEA